MKFLQIQIILAGLIFFSASIKAQNCDYDSTNVVSYSNEVVLDTTVIDTNTLQGLQQPNLPTDRIVYWVHGLGGNLNSWTKPSEIFMSDVPGEPSLARKIASENASLDYSLNVTSNLDGIAIDLAKRFQDLATNHNNGNYDRENGIVFAHSQGGIISRLIDERYVEGHETGTLKSYGGIVTFATSNQGAQIINNQDIMQDYLESFANDLSAGYLSMINKPQSFVHRLLVKTIGIDDLVLELRNIATKNIGEFLISENLPAITDEYKVGGSAVNRINAYTANSTDLVAFYAEKPKVYLKDVTFTDAGKVWNINDFPHPISWITIHYFLNASTSYDYLKAHEHESVTPINAFLTRRDYLSNKIAEQNLMDRLERKMGEIWCPIWLTPCIARLIVLESDFDAAESRKEDWEKGIRALDNFNEQYQIIIGARVKEQVEIASYTICICEEDDWPVYYRENPNLGECLDVAQENPEWDCRIDTIKHNIFTWVEKPSDGVVLSESASDIPQQTHPSQLMTGNLLNNMDIGTTHMELRNDVTTKNALNKIFDGNVGDFFQTDKRQ